MRRFFLSMFLFVSGYPATSQVLIYYNGRGEITMKDLASHYRIARIDTIRKIFIGNVVDVWLADSTTLSMSYDSAGLKDGPLVVKNRDGVLLINGQYSKGLKKGVWDIFGRRKTTLDFNREKAKNHVAVDTLELQLANKESFTRAAYIRKADYTEIYSLLRKGYSAHGADEMFTPIEVAPYFPGGVGALAKFIGAYIRYPEEAAKNGIKGQVIVEFTISTDGSIKDPKIVKSLGYGCDEEALRVMGLLPDWVPGYQRGRTVETKHRLPITFG